MSIIAAGVAANMTASAALTATRAHYPSPPRYIAPPTARPNRRAALHTYAAIAAVIMLLCGQSLRRSRTIQHHARRAAR